MSRLAKIVADERRKHGWSQSELARRVGVKPQSIQQLEASEVVRPRYIYELSQALGLDLNEYMKSGDVVSVPMLEKPESPVFPNPKFGAETPRNDIDIPVFASVYAAPDGMHLLDLVIEYIDRPRLLSGVRNSFAVYVVDDLMEPKYSRGDLLLINPGKPVRRGDSVLCIKNSDGPESPALVGELTDINAEEVTLRQYNPENSHRIELAKIQNLHKIIGVYWGG